MIVIKIVMFEKSSLTCNEQLLERRWAFFPSIFEHVDVVLKFNIECAENDIHYIPMKAEMYGKEF